MIAADLIALLKQKHWKDVCVEQCKMRSSWSGDRNRLGKSTDSPIMDLWVLPRSWRNGASICYEVKVSRADLFGDHKFPDYWYACKYFYFAVPNGLLTQVEMDSFPPQCGFIEVNGKGTGLRIKRKPYYMTGDIDETVYRYVLMWRSKIVSSHFREFS